MAGEAASLLVRITGDASQLEATISGVARSLQSLEKGGSGVSGTTQKAIDQVSKSTRSYADVVAGAKQQLDAKNTTLKRTQSEYDKTKRQVDKNIKTLSAERDQVEKLMKDQQKQIDRYEEMNRAAKKNSTAYKLNQEQLEKEHARMKELQTDYNDLTGRIDHQNEVLEKSQRAYRTARDDVNKASSQYRTLSANMAEVTRQEKAIAMQETGEHWQAVGQGIDEATRPLQTLAVATAAGGVAAAKFAIDFEDDFSAVKKTVEGTPEQLETIRQGIIDLTTVGRGGRNALPMTTAELTELAAAGGQLGIETENILDFTEVMAQLGTATNLVGSEGASQLARFMNVMGESQGNVRNVGSAVVDLGNNFATTEAEIMQMANRMGKYGTTVGMSTADVLGFSAALSSLGIEAEMGGSAIGRTWLSIETAVASGGEELEAFAKYSNKSAEQFAKDWDTDAAGAFMDLLEGLSNADNLTTALSELGINNTLDIQAMMAMANGIDLVSEALGRSNTAYAENTALQEEFDAKAETTASKLTVTKNNIVEAARGIGETMLPTITDMSTGIAEFAQKLAGLDEGTQRKLVGIGLGIVGIGTAAKGASSAVETIGTIVENIGKLRSVSAITSMIGPIAGVTAAITALGVAGTAVYKKLYKEEYQWADGLSESAEEIQEHADKLAELNSLKQEVEALELVINSPESSAQQVADAKARIEEIAQLLSETYHLNIEADTAQLKEVIDTLSDYERRDMIEDARGHIETMKGLRDNYKENPQKLNDLDSQMSNLSSREFALSDISRELDGLTEKYENAEISQEEYLSGFRELLSEAEKAKGDEDWSIPQGSVGVEDAYTLQTNLENMIGDMKAERDGIYEDYKELSDEQIKYEAAAAEAATALSNAMVSDYLSGNTSQANETIAVFKQLGAEMVAAGANTDAVSQSFALAKNGFTEFDQAVQAGALGAVANDFIEYQKSIGETAETAVQGAALLKNGFTDVSQAVNSVDPNAIGAVVSDMKQLGEQNGIEMTSDKLTEMARSMGLIDKNTTIEINAEGNIDLVNEAQEAVDRVNSEGDVKLGINAEGDISLLDTADERLKALAAEQDLTIEFNADTGNFEVFDEVDNKIAEIDGKTGTVTITATSDGNLEQIKAQVDEVNSLGDISLQVSANGDITLVETTNQALQELLTHQNVSFELNASGDGINILNEAKQVIGSISEETGITINIDVNEQGLTEAESKILDGKPKTQTIYIDPQLTGGDAVNDLEGKINYTIGTQPTDAEVTALNGKVNYTAGTQPTDADLTALNGKANYTIGTKPTDADLATLSGKANYTMGSKPTNADLTTLSGKANYTMGTHPTTTPDVSGTANYTMGDHPTEAPDIHGTAYYDVVINGESEATGTKNFPGGLAMVNDQKNVADPRELIIDKGRAFIPRGRNVILPLSKGAKVYTASQTKAIAKRLGIPGFAGGTNNSDKNSDAFTAAQDDLTHYLNTHAVTVSQELEKWVELSAQFTDNIKDAEDIEEEIYKLTRDRNEELNDESMKYIELRTAMNDWADVGDDPIAAFGRIRDRNLAELEAERLTWEEYSEIMAEAGSALYEGRLDQSYDWLEHQREYNDMSLDDYLAGLDRMKAYTQEYLDQGLIDYKTFRENMTDIDEEYYDTVKERNQEIVDAYFESADAYKEVRDTFDDWEDVGDSETRYYTARLANIEKLFRNGYMDPEEYYDRSREEYLNLYKAAEDQQQEMLDDFRDNISEIEEQFRDEEQALRDSWDVEDRGTDLDEVNRLLGIYENAATDQGRQKYKDLLEQKKELEREEQLYRLEQDNNARLAELEEEYDRMEARKAEMLKNMRTDTFNIFAQAETIAEDTSNMAELAGTLADAAVRSADEQTGVLYQILGALQGLRVNQTTYQDGRRITISKGLTESAAERLINGTIVTGMGTVMLYH